VAAPPVTPIAAPRHRRGARITARGRRTFNHRLDEAPPVTVTGPSGSPAGATVTARTPQQPAPCTPFICIDVTNISHCGAHGWTAVVQVLVTECSVPLLVSSSSATGAAAASPAEEPVEIHMGSTRAPSSVVRRRHHRSSSSPLTGSASVGTIEVRRWQPAASVPESSTSVGPSAPPPPLQASAA
jgi:hypothetical protein